MTGHQLKKYRKKSGLTQVAAARALGVSQTYLSLLENGDRPLNPRLERKAAKVFELSLTELPSKVSQLKVDAVTDDQLTVDLATLGYKGFSHYKPARRKNPADVLLSALNADNRDARLMEALPWLVLAFPGMNWHDVKRVAKMHDLQNRLGFVVSVARGLAEQRQDKTTAANLANREADLERSMLAREDTLCNERMTNAERKWLATNRPAEAKRWHLLSDLSPRYLDHYVD